MARYNRLAGAQCDLFVAAAVPSFSDKPNATQRDLYATTTYATDGLCHNAEPGTYGHECGAVPLTLADFGYEPADME